MGSACSTSAEDTDCSQRHGDEQCHGGTGNKKGGRYATAHDVTSTSATSDAGSLPAALADQELQAMYAELDSFAKSRKSSSKTMKRAVSSSGGAVAKPAPSPDDGVSSVGEAAEEPSPFVAGLSRSVREAKARWADSRAEPADPTVDVPSVERLRLSHRRVRVWLATFGDTVPGAPGAAGALDTEVLITRALPKGPASVAEDDVDLLCGAVPAEHAPLTEDSLEELQHSIAIRAAVQRHQSALFGPPLPHSSAAAVATAH